MREVREFNFSGMELDDLFSELSFHFAAELEDGRLEVDDEVAVVIGTVKIGEVSFAKMPAKYREQIEDEIMRGFMGDKP